MTTPRDTETWNRILRLYQQGVTIPQLALRFNLTNQGIRYVLMQHNALRKRKEACGTNACTN